MVLKAHPLIDPFPVDKIMCLDFGDADGHRDDIIENAFIDTSSIARLKSKNYSIVSGHIGTGKSAIYKLIKTKSSIFQDYLDKRMVIPIEEAISFNSLKILIQDYLPQFDNRLIYQTIWLFHVSIRISEKISSYNNFPQNNDEKEINKFLKQTNSKGSANSIVDKILFLFDNFTFNIEAKVSDKPISLKAGVSQKKTENLKININKIIKHCSQAISQRNFKDALIIIDKIDKFVAGERYNVQKDYIESLLEVEDDLYSIGNIKFNIFVRSDLLKRLDYSSLGTDKIYDRILKLEWSDDELIQFIGHRIRVALEDAKIITSTIDLIIASDLSRLNIKKSFFQKKLPTFARFYRRYFIDFNKIYLKKEATFVTTLNLMFITKLFPRKAIHCTLNGQAELIDTEKFLTNKVRLCEERTTI